MHLINVKKLQFKILINALKKTLFMKINKKKNIKLKMMIRLNKKEFLNILDNLKRNKFRMILNKTEILYIFFNY